MKLTTLVVLFAAVATLVVGILGNSTKDINISVLL